MISSMIRDYIEKKGIDVAASAKSNGCDLEKIRNILSKDTDINAEEYFLICKVLHVDLNYFFNCWRDEKS